MNVITNEFLGAEPQRAYKTAPIGSRLDFIVANALPYAEEAALSLVRVCVITGENTLFVPRAMWGFVTPKLGAHVVITVVAGKDVLKSVLQILVSVIAAAAGTFFFGAGTLAAGLFTFGATALGSLLINALIPPDKPKKEKENFAISGFRNQFSPNGPVASVLGKHRYAPQLLATSYTEMVGDIQYIHGIFGWGCGRVQVDPATLKLGDTPFNKFDEIQYEFREGIAGDAPHELYPNQIYEEQIGAALERPIIRDDAGNPTSAATVSKPISRFTASSTSKIGLVLSFPSGLIFINKKGKKKTYSVNVGVRYRLNGTGAWTVEPDWNISKRKTEGFFVQNFITPPARGLYEVELSMLTPEVEYDDGGQVAATCAWALLQSYKPEYPLNTPLHLSTMAMRVKATKQLNGQLDNVNGIAERVCMDWDYISQTWIERKTSNPASLLRLCLTGEESRYPFPLSALNLVDFQSFHDHCRLKNLKYDRVHDDENSWHDVLSMIAGAGRATLRHDGVQFGVVIDRPQSLIIDHISPRNSRDFTWARNYVRPPHAFRVPFLDETNDYLQAERLVPRPGYTGAITVTEELPLAGVTNPSQAYLAAIRRWHELTYRPDVFTLIQDGAARVATRGDLVAGSFDTLDKTMFQARVKTVSGNIVTLDDTAYQPSTAINYGCRFISIASDGVMTSVVTPVKFPSPAVLVFTAAAVKPQDGDICLIGPMGNESMRLIVSRVEPTQDMSAHLTLVAEAPEIDQLTDSTTPPVWLGRYGFELPPSTTQPAAPVFTEISTGIDGAGAANNIFVRVAPGPVSPVSVGGYIIQHRLSGAGVWTQVNVTAGTASATITAYAAGNTVELSAIAVSVSGVQSTVSATKTTIIGSADPATPAALSNVTVSPALGYAFLAYTPGANTNEVRIYRMPGTGNTLDPASIKYTVSPVIPGSGYNQTDGDSTRVNLFANGQFNAAGATTYETGWSFNTNRASKAAGVANWVFEALTLTNAVVYRAKWTLLNRTAGGAQFGLKGSTNVLGASKTANGTYYERLTGISGLTGAGVIANTTLAGDVDDLIIYPESGICLPQGAHEWFFVPYNDAIPGPVFGPVSGTII